MAYIIPSICISEDSPEGHLIEEIVVRDAISPEAAVLKILREHSAELVEDGPALAEARRQRKLARRISSNERPESPEMLIGCLSEHPEVVLSILEYTYQRRAEAF